MNANRWKWLGFGVLLLMMAALGWFMIPAHVTSIWMDGEFTDWMTPIANRLHNGARLYDDGMHSPMPPLPYVLLRVLHPEGAIWIQESFLNFAFETASVLLLYLVFSRLVGPGLAFAACMGTIPVFLTFGKTILYDSMAHFLVVVCALLTATMAQSIAANTISSARPRLFRGILTGLALGVLLLTKQSTGMGAMVGICLTLVFLPAKLPFKLRCVNVILVVAVTAATVITLCLAMTKYVSFSGMVHDVFLSGSEPKGGNRRIFNNFVRYAFAISKIIAIAALVFYAVSALLRRKFGWRNQAEDFETTVNFPIRAGAMDLATLRRIMLTVLLTGAACAVAIYYIPMNGGVAGVLKSAAFAQIKLFLLNLGLAAGLCLAAVALLQSLRQTPGTLTAHPLVPFAVIFFFAALFHNLSITVYRWVSDSNAFIALAQIFLLGPLLGAFKPAGGWPRKWAAAGMVLFICCIGFMWAGFFNQFKMDMTCTVAWPEIPHLAGARLRPECDALRQLVKTVQTLADKNKHDTVLLLPDDPNLETWFDRERPPLSSTIIFTDQYWDRYVDADFASLQAHPPKVIIIGPRNFWRSFSQIWHWRKHEGLIRLVDRVQDELIPARYDLYEAHRISFGPGSDFLDVYVRKDK